ncbi:STAS domain-containing protein [Actinoplanes sp. NPDC051494]|uniref:STAS domain-containing protein n=1 Tax=Actinoplanes sp. NPDC051494 TaxID=3363907 RepID=UPI00379D5D7E
MTAQLPGKTRRKTRIGLVAGGLGTYWPQFPDLLPQLQESARYVSQRFQDMDAEVTDAGFISDAQEGAVAAEQLRKADCDLIVLFLTTYLTASMVLPIAQRSNTPILVIDLQPTEKMDHANFGTGEWLAYCGQCPVPEIGNTFRRAGIPFRSVSGWLRQESAWERIGQWIRAAHVRAALRHARHGLMGHLYPGMLDVSTDLTLLPATFGSHVEVLEFDDLRVRVEKVTDTEVSDRMRLVREIFTLDGTVDENDFAWGAKVSVGLDRLVEDFDLDSLAYYHRGLDGEQHERLGAGMILGASLLTARGIPASGEYELRTTVAQLATQVVGAGGSFCELQALNFEDDVVEMGHDGPAHLAVGSREPRRLRPRPGRLGRRLERVRCRPPLVAVAGPPRGRLPRRRRIAGDRFHPGLTTRGYGDPPCTLWRLTVTDRRGRPDTELVVTTVGPAGGHAHIHCAGEIDETTAPLLAAAIEAAAPASTRIEINLAEVEFIDSSGISTLVRHCSDDYDLALVDIPAHVLRLLEITGLTDLFAP